MEKMRPLITMGGEREIHFIFVERKERRCEKVFAQEGD